DRETGFRAGLAESGRSLPDTRTRRGPFEFGYGHAGIGALVDAGATAVFCANDVIALGVFNALRGRGVRVPQQLTLIGFDDISTAAWEAFELSTVSQDIPRLVETAVGLLLERIARGGRPDLP